LTIDDSQAETGARALERAAILAGPSGAAGLAGLLALRKIGEHGIAAKRLGIDGKARLLVFCTESAGD
jgi:diaminopropionate ammonia-lyase